ncbi:MAG: gamma-glutamyltransferase 1, Threonine peptidase family [Myxococcales bacterium]|nr:gamma-glutamyltransferase 1, Threonine peptidase family [Myxococcales bacterium]
MPRLGLERSPFRNLIPKAEGCVVSYCPIASAVGTRVLLDGGNAVDAMVATALALAATYPQAGNLAGGGFMLIKPPGGEGHLLDYRESAPRLADPVLFATANDRSVRGGLAVAVPGTVAGLAEAVRRFGTWSWDRLVRPAIDLAEHGTWITNRQARYLSLYHKDLASFPETAQAMLPPEGMWRPGDLFCNPDLGKTLRLLGENGPDAFRQGPIADAIIRTVQKYGGVMDHGDLLTYEAIWRKPYHRRIFGHDIMTTPLPSGGGFIVILSLALLEAAGCAALPVRSTARYELLARAFRIAYALRAEFAGDPKVVPAAMLARCEELTQMKFDAGSIERFERELGLVGERPVREPFPPQNTTHMCAIDSSGMAVSNTYSLNTLFGSKLVAEGTGSLLNNTIDDFGILPDVPNWYQLFEGKYNTLAPGLRPLGSMAPTIVSNGDVVELVIGGSGGPRIPTAVAQTILGMYGNGLALSQAAALPRVHHQYRPTQLDVEDSLDASHQEALERLGFDVVQFPRLGILAAAQYDVNAKTLMALLDSRF